MRHTMRRHAGFSLIELMVAMSITLIVSGAIYGLMAGGQNAFRREPELTERQQNIRIAMDLIMRDVAQAGVGLPSFMQTFSRNLNACTGCPNGGSPMGTAGEVADELEIVANTGEKSNEPACDEPGQSMLVRLARTSGNIAIGTPVIIIMADGNWTMRVVTDISQDNSTSGACTGGPHTKLTFSEGAADTSGVNQINASNEVCKVNEMGIGTASGGACNPTEISFAEIIRWRIRNGADGVPELQRFSVGQLAANPLNPWLTVARGIEDLQVQYTQQSGATVTGAPGAPAVVQNDFTSMITRVQVTLWARATGATAGIAGLRTSAGGLPAALRGSLTSAATPRAALFHLANQVGVPSPKPIPLWQ